MASQRQRQIIELLQSHKTGLSGNDLSNFLGVSSRTIRTDIKALEGELRPMARPSMPIHETGIP